MSYFSGSARANRVESKGHLLRRHSNSQVVIPYGRSKTDAGQPSDCALLLRPSRRETHRFVKSLLFQSIRVWIQSMLLDLGGRFSECVIPIPRRTSNS